jgi:predicted phage terminase large subunit-like protein
MAQKRTQNKSKRDRLEDARGILRAAFQAGQSQNITQGGTAKALQPEPVLQAAWELASDIDCFVRKYLPHYMVDQETGVAIEPAAFHKEIYEFALSTKRAAIAAPREHAKSTVISLFFVLYCICYKLRKFIVLISDTEAQAILLVGAVKAELESNDELRKDFGDLVDSVKWGERDIITATGTRLSARGAGQSLRGLRQRQFRPDLVICDDLEDDEHIDNPDYRKKLERWFKNVVLNLGKKCQVFVIGTILHYDSLLSHLLDAEKFKKFLKRKYEAIDEERTPESVLWSGHWSYEDLAAKEEDIGLTEFNQEYRNQPISSDTASFKESDIIRHSFTRSEIAGKQLVKLTGIDPAISKKEKADDFASVTIGIDEHGYILVLRAEGKHLSFPEQWRFVLQRFDEEQPIAIGVETIAYQKALKEHVEEVSRETQRYIPVVEIKSDTDKFRRIVAISPLVENGTIRFCLDGTQKKLISQLLYLGKIKDDLADALTMAVAMARERGFKPAMASSTSTEAHGRDRGAMSRAAQEPERDELAESNGQEWGSRAAGNRGGSDRRSVWAGR